MPKCTECGTEIIAILPTPAPASADVVCLKGLLRGLIKPEETRRNRSKSDAPLPTD